MEFRNLLKTKRNFQYMDNSTPVPASTSNKDELTKEEKEIIERNKQAAIERRKKLEMERQRQTNTTQVIPSNAPSIQNSSIPKTSDSTRSSPLKALLDKQTSSQLPNPVVKRKVEEIEDIPKFGLEMNGDLNSHSTPPKTSSHFSPQKNSTTNPIAKVSPYFAKNQIPSQSEEGDSVYVNVNRDNSTNPTKKATIVSPSQTKISNFFSAKTGKVKQEPSSNNSFPTQSQTSGPPIKKQKKDEVEDDVDENQMVSALAIPRSQKNSNVNKPSPTDRQLFSSKKDVEKKPPKNSQTLKPEPTPIPIPIPTPIPSKSGDSNQFSKFAFGNSQSDSEKQFEEDQRIPFVDKATERATLRTPKPTGRNESRMEWLDDIRDSNGKRPGDPDYDPSTFFIPPKAWDGLTDAMKDYYQLKCKFYDVVIFFQRGAFYNVFEKDADICVKELGWQYTHGSKNYNFYTAGISVDSFDLAAKTLIARGYKVGKVDQVKNPEKKQTKAKAVDRALDRIFTPATAIEETFIFSNDSIYLLSIKEELSLDGIDVKYGICLLDSTIGEFSLGEFPDDKYRSNLETLLYQVKPQEIIYEKGNLSQVSLTLIKNIASLASLKAMNAAVDFWTGYQTFENLARRYFKDKPEKWHPVLKKMKDCEVVFSAFGGCVSYIETLNIANELVSQNNFKIYNVHNQLTSLMLDGVCLKNLNILEAADGSSEGTLLKFLDHCETPFGKRMLRKWVCHPLRNIRDINERLDAVEELRQNTDVYAGICLELRMLPDLERKISRIHTSRVSLKSFIELLNGLIIVANMLNKTSVLVNSRKIQSRKLHELTTFGSSKLPDVSKKLKYFYESIDLESSLQQNELVLGDAFRNQFKDEFDNVSSIEAKLSDYLQEQQQLLRIPGIKYQSGKETTNYILEIPVKALDGVKIPKDYQLIKELKNVHRYTTPALLDLVSSLNEAKNGVQNMSTGLLEKFENELIAGIHFLLIEFLDLPMWKSLIEAVSELDCLCSFAKATMSTEMKMCRPILKDSGKGYMKLHEVYHPCVSTITMSGFITNNVSMGADAQPSIILLTGPNMGGIVIIINAFKLQGKSTLLRSTCIAAVMAQLGCFVAAEYCELTPADRIFTRIGARDDILHKQSTFMVELHETAQILRHATVHSIILLDELGRGTSTFDGYSIAYSVLKHFADKLPARIMFATHYHLLTEELHSHPNIQLAQMAFVLNDEELVFTYKLEPGVCPKSYGLKVAHNAGIPEPVISRAEEISEKFRSKSYSYLHKQRYAQRNKKYLTVSSPSPISRISLKSITPYQRSLLSHILTPNTSSEDNSLFLELWKALKGK